MLDFQDLIDKTLALLSRGDTDWVLYKLDRGIDHVLVDEAQDTNRQQWEILRRITADFTAGHGARGERVRTLFAVGDPKQSIYSFQGAEPQRIRADADVVERKVCEAELRFEDVRLTLSFRSGLAVLSAVDATFALREHFKRPLLRGDGCRHRARERAAERARPRRVVADRNARRRGGAGRLGGARRRAGAERAARRRRKPHRAGGAKADDDRRREGHVWRPGEVLILVRKRGVAFEAVIRALKEAGVPVAGADRLNIGEHIAVLDLVAAGRAALLERTT